MTNEQIAAVISIREPSDITSFKVENVYEDDHAMCADVVINGTPLEFLWYDNVGFIEYWKESPKAMNHLVNAIMAAIQMKLDMVDEWTDQHVLYKNMVEDYFNSIIEPRSSLSWARSGARPPGFCGDLSPAWGAHTLSPPADLHLESQYNNSMKREIKNIIKKIEAMTPKQSLKDVLTKQELALWRKLNDNQNKAELKALPSYNIYR